MIYLLFFLPLLTSQTLASPSLQGKSKDAAWGSFWWSNEKAEVALGWNHPESGRKRWTPTQIKNFDRCLEQWKPSCDSYLTQNGASLSPLMKFDLYVFQKTRKNRDKNTVTSDELSHSSLHEMNHIFIRDRSHPEYPYKGFAGKCTGWSLANLEYPEPIKTKKIDGIVFTPADIKALLASYFYGAQLFVDARDAIGTAVRPQMRGNTLRSAREDVLPHQFLAALQLRVGKNKSMLVADLDPELPVWNHPIFEYKISISQNETLVHQGRVTFKYANALLDKDAVYTRSKRRKDHKTDSLEFEFTAPKNWNGDFSRIKKSEWINESIDHHPDSLILKVDSNWKELILDYLDDENLSQAYNVELLQEIPIGRGHRVAAEALFDQYFH